MDTAYNNAAFILISLGYMGIPEEVGWIILAGLATPLQAVERNLWQLFNVQSFCQINTEELKKVWELAAKNIWLQILKKLHHNGVKYPSAAIWVLAALNGHLEIVGFLHENRNEGCTTTEAMDLTAFAGNLERTMVTEITHNRKLYLLLHVTIKFKRICSNCALCRIIYNIVKFNKPLSITTFTPKRF